MALDSKVRLALKRASSTKTSEENDFAIVGYQISPRLAKQDFGQQIGERLEHLHFDAAVHVVGRCFCQQILQLQYKPFL